jgi:hypothetical protein
MADKPLQVVGSAIKAVEAKISSAGAGDAGRIVALDAAGRIDNSMMPVGIGADTQVVEASENLAAGDLVNIHNSTGAKARKADATTAGKEAHGFVLAAVTSGQPATVYFEGSNTQVTGLTPGPQYLSTTPGLSTHTPPSGSGNILQKVGVATDAAVLNFEGNGLTVEL